MCNGKIFFVQIAMMELQCPVVAVVSTVLACAAFVVNAELFKLALALNGLLVHAGLAVRRIAGFTPSGVELIERF